MPTHLKPILAFLFLLALCITVSLTPLTSHRPAPPRTIDELVNRALASGFKHGLASVKQDSKDYNGALYAAARRTVPTDNASARQLIDLFAADPNWFYQPAQRGLYNYRSGIAGQIVYALVINAADQPTDDQLIYALQNLHPCWGYKAPEGYLIDFPIFFPAASPSLSANHARRLALLTHVANTTTNPDIAKEMNDATKRVIAYANANGARVTTLEEAIQAAADWEAAPAFLYNFVWGVEPDPYDNLWRTPPKR